MELIRGQQMLTESGDLQLLGTLLYLLYCYYIIMLFFQY